MWYFLIKQGDLMANQYRSLQQNATLTEVELFNEPYSNWYVIAVEKGEYTTFMDQLDREGIIYELTATRPTRDELLAMMR